MTGSRFVIYAAAMIAAASPRVARAATFTVNSTADLIDANPGDGACAAPPPAPPGTCTLRAAIMEANALPGVDTINLMPTTYALTINGPGENAARSGDLDITGPLTIIGSGPLATIIDASRLAPKDRVFHVLGGPVTFQQLQITGGGGQMFGTGIFDQNARVTLHEVRVQDNHATADGGGVRATGANARLTITSSTFVLNSAVNGGGIAIDNGAVMTMNDSDVSNNDSTTGGGLYSHGLASATVTDDTFDGNTATDGGGIANIAATVSTARGSITNNSATTGGGIENVDGTISVAATSIETNDAETGGGIYQDEPNGGAAMTLTSATLTANTASGSIGGGGIYAHHGGATIDLSRIDSNRATTGPGGGMVLDPGVTAMTILHTTITANTAGTNGGGIAYPGSGDAIAIQRSTIDNNTATGDGGGVWGAALGSSQVLKSTVAWNFANGRGGGMWLAAQTAGTAVSVLHSTFGSNTSLGGGGSLWVEATGSFTTYHVILAGGGPNETDGPGTVTSRGYNLVQTKPLNYTKQPTDIIGKLSRIGPLQDNGGATWTRAITSASPAYNAGDPTDCGTGGNTDQRDDPSSPMPNGTACDIGAYEAP